MGTKFWIKRFLVVLVGAFAIITAAQLFKGHGLGYASTHGALWGLITAAVFTVARFIQARRGQHCVICKDTPEMLDQEPRKRA